MHSRRSKSFRKKIYLFLVFCVLALVGCGSSSSSKPPTISGSIPPTSVVSTCAIDSTDNTVVSGTVTFDRVLHTNNALDYSNIISQVVRGAVVEIVCNDDGLTLVAGITGKDGSFNLSLPKNTENIFVRVKAQMENAGTPAWNFMVVDNTQNKALYVLDGSSFDLGVDPVMRNLHAPSGWDGSSYATVRAAAPFAILHSIYDAFNKVLLADPEVIFPPLKLNWSKNNTVLPGDLSLGQITTSFFNGDEIYLLGAANVDTDEYDDHVIIHEFTHYLEAKFSRSDSIGGGHSRNDYLDIRVAFSEGLANAFSGMVNDDPVYRDSSGLNQGDGFGFDVDDNNCGNKGWFSECSVHAIIYDLYDNASEPVDTLDFGFTPLFDVLINDQKNTNAMISIFSFIHQLKQKNPLEASGIDTLVSDQNIDVIGDIYGDSQISNDPGSQKVLPVQGQITIDGVPVNVCSTDEFKVGNGLGLFRLLRFTMPNSEGLTISAAKTSGSGIDPDIYLHEKGQVVSKAESTNLENEVLITPVLDTGKTYIIEVYEFGNTFDGVGVTCFDVSVSS